MPSSIMSQQEERNKTIAVPTGTDAIGTTQSYDRSYTTLQHDPITMTLYGGDAATVSLPEVAVQTEVDQDNSASMRGYSGVWATASCMLVLAIVYR